MSNYLVPRPVCTINIIVYYPMDVMQTLLQYYSIQVSVVLLIKGLLELGVICIVAAGILVFTQVIS